jgi:flagellar biosynthesis/type III secretory pathway protein FliH
MPKRKSEKEQRTEERINKAARETLLDMMDPALLFSDGTTQGAEYRLRYVHEITREAGAQTAEDGYRRGYIDGYQEGLLAARNYSQGKGFWTRIYKFVNAALTDWKLIRRNTVVVPPRYRERPKT